jgi:NAD(P)-dependent dehydrogenase (short-subunit alcohol dehydrogenase family)
MNTNESDPVALVTGGAVRVGRAIALELAKIGYRVAVHYHSSIAEAKQLTAESQKTGSEIMLIQADLTQPAAPKAIVSQTVERAGRLDLLVNNAAILVKDNASMSALARMKLLNVDAPRACIRSASPHLERVEGSVVNIADVAGLAPFSKHKAYSRTKAALIELTKKKATDLAPKGVRVNAICPGTVLPHAAYTPKQIERLVEQILMGRLGNAQDVADAVSFFSRAQYVTGQILAIDGGLLLAADQAEA